MGVYAGRVNADGSIIIDTRIDTKGVDKGVTSLKKQFSTLAGTASKLGAVIGLAFSVTAVVQFGKEASKAAREASDALIGLKSILEGQGRSFSDAQQFINEYTEDGLIPATNAITAYKNLAMRGYDDSQIRQVMVALKDASAYGRQASYTMGDAVQSATEGLKNENSVLVDNAGVTKNVAKMWEEYAASIGTTANNLTTQQKIQAEVSGILEESQYQTGDAARVANTLSGQLQKLSFNFNNLKIAVGNITNPFVQYFLPVMNAAISAVTRFANTIASVVNTLFGTKMGELSESLESVGSGYKSAAEGAENLAASTGKAAKESKKFLAGFDEITKLSGKESPGGGGGSSNNGGTGGSALNSAYSATSAQDNLSPQIEAIVEKIKKLIEPLHKIDFSALKGALGDVQESFRRLGGTIIDSLEWVWSDILVPLSTWVIEDAAPASVGLLSDAFASLTKVLAPVRDGFAILIEKLRPIFSFLGDTAVMAIDFLRETFQKVAAVFTEKGSDIITIFSEIGEIISVVWTYVIGPALEEARTGIIEILDAITDVLAETISNTIDTIRGFVDIVSGILSGDWRRAWSGVVSVVKSAVNGVISGINGLVKGCVAGINAVIRALNRISFDVPSWVPVYGGNRFGLNISQITAPQIPYLAQGAVIPPNAPFMAMLGDQRHGVNVEAPLSTIQEAVSLVMEDYAAANLAGHEATVAVLRDILEAVLGIEIGDDVIGSAAQRWDARRAIMRGGR